MAEKTSSYGLSYDFGVEVASGALSKLAQVVAGTTTLVGTMYALVDASADFDAMMNKNRVAMGGYDKALNAHKFALEKVMSGKSYFDVEDIGEAQKSFRLAGLAGEEAFDLINRAAATTGQNIASVAEAVKQGNAEILKEMGLVGEDFVRGFNNMGYTARQATDALYNYIKKRDLGGAFKEGLVSIPKLLGRFKTFGEDILLAVWGDERDPTSFIATTKRFLKEAGDFMYKHMHEITHYAAVVGKVLKYVGLILWDTIKFISSLFKGMISVSADFFKDFFHKLLGYELTLAIIRVRIRSFFEEHRAGIILIAKVLAAYMGWKAVMGVFGLLGRGIAILGTSLVEFGILLRTATWTGFITSITGSGGVLYNLNRVRLGIISVTMELRAMAITAVSKFWWLASEVTTKVFPAIQAGFKNLLMYMAWGLNKVLTVAFMGINKLIGVFYQLGDAVKAVGVGMANVVKQAWAWVAANYANPIFWIPALIAAIVAGSYLIYKYWDDIADFFRSVVAWAKELYIAFIHPFKVLLDGIEGVLASLGMTKGVNVTTTHREVRENVDKRTPAGLSEGSRQYVTESAAKSSMLTKNNTSVAGDTIENNVQAGAIVINQLPGQNSDELANKVRDSFLKFNRKEELRKGK